MTTREKLFLLGLLVFLSLLAISYFEVKDPQRKYLKNELYCKLDADCMVVYDLLTQKCLTVNLANRHKYDSDISCRRRTAFCRGHRCLIP